MQQSESLTNWAQNMEQQVTDANLPDESSKALFAEANQVLNDIEAFTSSLETWQANKRNIDLIAGDLVAIRRRGNLFSLSMYLSTLDMRWPGTSMSLSTIVDRVQQACLERSSVVAMEAPPADIFGKLKIIGKNISTSK